MEKFFDIVCRGGGLRPNAVVLVATVRALKHHGGIEDDPRVEHVRGLAAIATGAANLHRHLGIVRSFGLPCVVAVNRRPGDTDEEVELVRSLALEGGALAAEVNDAFARGGEGAAELAQAVADACEEPSEFKLAYEDDDPIDVKIQKVAKQVYGASDVVFYLDAERKIRQYTEDGLDKLPICMAKTHLSLSADPALLNAPEDFTLPVRDMRAYTGAGWLVPLCGDIQQMPGLGKAPAALNVDIDARGEDSRAVLRCRATSPTCCARTSARRGRPRWPCSRRRWTSAARSPTTTAAAAAALSGLPEATVYGVSTFYDDLVQPRGERHVSVCTGTACWARTSATHVAAVEEGLGVGWASAPRTARCRSARRSAWASATPRAPCARATWSTPARTWSSACSRAPCARPSEPGAQSVLDEPVLLARGTFEGLRHALDSLSPEELLEEVKEANVRGRGGAGFPAGTKWEFAARAADPDKAIVVNGDEGDPGSYIDKLLMERNPELLLEGMALAGYAVGARHGYVLVRSEYPLSTRILREAVERSRGDARRLRRRGRGGRRLVRGRARRPRCWRRCRASAARSPRARRSPPSAASTASRPWSTTSRRSATSPSSRCTARRPTRRSARAPRPAPSSSASTTASQRPGMYEVRFGTPVSRDLRGARRRAARRPLDQGGADRRAAGRHPARLEARHAVRLRRAGRRGLHGRPRRHPRLRRAHRRCARWRATCSSSARTRAAASASPAGSGCSARSRWSTGPGDVDRERLEALLETLELGSLCAHGGGMPAPIRTPDRALRRGAGRGRRRPEPDRRPVHAPAGGAPEDDPGRPPRGATGRHEGRDRRPGASRSSPARRSWRPPRRPAATCRRSASTTAWRRSAPAASAWSASRARPRRSPPARRRAATTCSVDTDDATARRIAAATVELVLSELPEPPAEHTELAAVARYFEIGEPRWQGERAPPRPRPPPSLPGAAARALHLVRALRARVRRDPGRVRADRHRPRLPLRHHRRPGQRLRRLDLRFVRRVRRHLPDRRHHRALPARHGVVRTLGKEALRDLPLRRDHHHDLRLLRRRAAGWRRTAPTGGSPRSARRWTAPPTRATPASRAASRTSSRARATA